MLLIVAGVLVYFLWWRKRGGDGYYRTDNPVWKDFSSSSNMTISGPSSGGKLSMSTFARV